MKVPAAVKKKARKFVEEGPPVVIRRRSVANPERLRRVLELYIDMCEKDGTGFWVTFQADGTPTSMNYLWNITADGRGYKSKKTRGFEEALLASARQVFKRKVRGTCAIILAVESALWIKQDNTVRQMDIDNKLKSPIDAFKTEFASGDHQAWETLIFKVQSKRERTTVWVFEMGDIVDCYE